MPLSKQQMQEIDKMSVIELNDLGRRSWQEVDVTRILYAQMVMRKRAARLDVGSKRRLRGILAASAMIATGLFLMMLGAISR